MPNVSFVGVLIVALVAFLAPLLLGLSPARRLPSVVIEIVAGIVLGPSVLEGPPAAVRWWDLRRFHGAGVTGRLCPFCSRAGESSALHCHHPGSNGARRGGASARRCGRKRHGFWPACHRRRHVCRVRLDHSAVAVLLP